MKSWRSREVAITFGVGAAAPGPIPSRAPVRPRGATVLIWSERLGGEAEYSRPIGSFTIEWRAPTEGMATVRRMTWDTAYEGGEAEVWRAIGELTGLTAEPATGCLPGGGPVAYGGEPVPSDRAPGRPDAPTAARPRERRSSSPTRRAGRPARRKRC